MQANDSRFYSDRQVRLSLRAQDGRPVAKVYKDGSGRLYSLKYVQGTKHQLRTPPGWAYDKSAIRDAERLGVVYHVIADREANRSFAAWHKDFEKHGFDVCRWESPQRALGLAFWNPGTTPRPIEQSLFDSTEEAA